MRLFYDQVLATESDIFADCSATRAPYTRFMLTELHISALKLEEYTILCVTSEGMSKLVHVLGR